jgi:hemerythrin superfamily protein
MHHKHHGHGGLKAGVALGLLAGLAIPHARKAIMQGPSVAAGDWIAALTAEHRVVQALFEKVLKTSDTQAAMRDMLLFKIAHALTKHGVEEENVIYPAMAGVREADKDHLVRDHAEIKTFLYELRKTPSNDPGWRSMFVEFRDYVDDHIREEEEEVFPAFRDTLSGEDNRRLFAMLNWEGFKVA